MTAACAHPARFLERRKGVRRFTGLWGSCRAQPCWRTERNDSEQPRRRGIVNSGGNLAADLGQATPTPVLLPAGYSDEYAESCSRRTARWTRPSGRSAAQACHVARRWTIARACIAHGHQHGDSMLTTENILDTDDGLLLFLEPARRHACNQRRIRRARRLNTARAASNSELLAIYKSVLNDYLAYAKLTDATVLSFVSVEEYIFSWCDDPDDTVCDVLAYLSCTIDNDPQV